MEEALQQAKEDIKQEEKQAYSFPDLCTCGVEKTRMKRFLGNGIYQDNGTKMCIMGRKDCPLRMKLSKLEGIWITCTD